MSRNNTFTASRASSLLRCMRAHYWRYEVGLTRTDSSPALRFGTAWHRGLEALNKGDTVSQAFYYALADCASVVDEYDVAKLSGLLFGYYEYWKNCNVATIQPELQFKHSAGIEGWTIEGKIDCIATLPDSSVCLTESKTTSESVASDSEYWLRLRFNFQVFQYALAARELGYDLPKVIYDVCRKPTIKPKLVDDVDADGCKIVNDQDGKRVFKKDGSPRQSGSESDGYTVQRHRETPDEYCDRLVKDVQSRPDFYFARREVPLLYDDLKEFQSTRLTLIKLIESCRDRERDFDEPSQAWPRNVAKENCRCCIYQSFCLQGITPDIHHPPSGFSIQPFNPELSNDTTTDQTIIEDDNADVAAE